MSVRIFLADDHTIFRSGLKSLLEQEAGFEVVGEAGDGFETVQALVNTDVDVLLLDLNMPGLSGALVARRVLHQKPDLAIVILTMHADEFYMREMFRIGARAYVLKQSDKSDLVRAVRRAVRGERFVDVSMAELMLGYEFDDREIAGKEGLGLLTGREKEVCSLLAYGHTNAEIADRLNISPRTVETHRSRIMAKLGLRSRAELVRFSIDHGLLALE